jgi:hypothetical protein
MSEMKDAAAADRIASVSYTFTEREFMAAHRAMRISRQPSYDSFTSRLGVIVAGHVMLLAAIEVLVLWLLGVEGDNGPIPGLVVVLGLAIGVYSAWALYSKIYCYRRHLQRLYQSYPLRDEKMFYQFTPLRFIFQHRFAQGSTDWSLIDRATELKDGFVIQQTAEGGDWIPKHALDESFGDVELSNLLRSKVKRFKVVDRAATLSEKPAKKMA